MKSRVLIAIAVAGLFSTAAIADKTVFYNPHRDTIDVKTGGYKGWGPMPNPVSAAADTDNESTMRERAQHLAEVNQVRERIWVANAPLREPYTSREALAAYVGETTAVGATRSSGGGILRFFQRDR